LPENIAFDFDYTINAKKSQAFPEKKINNLPNLPKRKKDTKNRRQTNAVLRFLLSLK